MKGVLVFSAALLGFTACASQEPLCPADSTADYDVVIAQITRPDVHLWPVGTEELPRAIPTPTVRFVPTSYVEYAVDVINRTSAPVRLKQIRLATPRVDRRQPQALCFGVESLPAAIERTSRSVDKVIPAGGRGRVFMKVLEYSGGDSAASARVVRMRIRLQTGKGTRDEWMSRTVVAGDR